MEYNEEPPEQAEPDQPEPRAFLMVILGTVGLGIGAYAFSLLLGVPLTELIRPDINNFAIGIIATLPLAGFLWWFSNTTLEHFAAFRKSQIKFFSEIGFEFTPARIALMAVCAGVSEELLFRGLLQSWFSTFAPAALAIIVSNLIFGMLHMRTLLYALIAGLVGVYLGVLFELTGNLVAPIVTHTLYDAVALEYTRRAVANYQT